MKRNKEREQLNGIKKDRVENSDLIQVKMFMRRYRIDIEHSSTETF